jgi:type III restriction enzyme
VKQVVIENPVINSPFREPDRHFKFTDEGISGEAKNYVPAFIARIDDGHGLDDLLNLLIEVTAEKKKDKAAKVSTARTLWVPAVNNHGGFARWRFIEVDDPWNAENQIREEANR